MSKLNKLVTNYPVSLSPKEVENLSATLAPVVAACGGGGGTPIYYYGDDVNINISTARVIRLTDAATSKLNRDIPTKVSDLTDSANYQTTAEMASYETTQHASQTYLTKSSADNDYAPVSITADVNTLKTASANWDEVSAKLDTTVAAQTYLDKTTYATDSATFLTQTSASQNLAPISVTADVEDLKTASSNYYTKEETSGADEISNALANYAQKSWVLNITNDKQNKLTNEELSAISSVSSIKGTVLTGDSNISVASAEEGNNIKWTLQLTAQPVVTDTTLSGHDGIVAVKDSNVSSQWNVSIAQAYREEIEAVSGKLTKSSADTLYAPITIISNVNTLTAASAGWNEVTAKLDKSIYSNASGNWEASYNVLTSYSAAGTWLTAHQSLTNYYTKSETSGKSEIENALTGKQDKLTFAGESNTITSINNSAVGGGISFTGVTTAGSISGDGLTNPLGLVTSAENALTSVASKVDKPTGAGLSDDFLIYQTTGTTSGWESIDNWWQTKSTEVVEYEYIPSTILPQQGLSSNWDNSNAELSFGLSADYVNAITSVSSKVDKPTSLANKYLVLRTDTNGDVSGWSDLQEQCYSKTEATGTFVATANIDTTTLSGDGKTSSTKLGVKTDVIATKDYVNSSFLPLSGGTVSGNVTVKSTGNTILAVNTTATLMGQSRVADLTDTTAIGTNWMGVNSYGGGFLKNVQGGDVGALNGTSIQINFAPDGATSYGNITVESQGNNSKIVHVPTASYNSMSSFDNTNGPNYMLRKTASGFDIGAAVINVTSLPATTEANTYYFVYDV